MPASLARLRRGVRRGIEDAAASLGAPGALIETPRGEAVIVEGYGGAMTPIRRDHLVADLARDMGVPTVIVTGNGFDAAGHSTMAVSHCAGRGGPCGGIRGQPHLEGRAAGVAAAQGVRRHGAARARVGREQAAQGGLDTGRPRGPTARAAIGASKSGDVDGAAGVVFGAGEGV